MNRRRLSDFGLPPVLGFLLFLIGFVGLSIFLFSKSDFAAYLYILMALSFVSKLSEPKRTDFLKVCFKGKGFLKLRLIENLLVVFPFIAFVVFKQLYMFALVILAIALLMALVNINATFSYTIPTLFRKKPFEFTVGFRTTFYLFFFAYLLTFMAIWVGNFNLGVFSLLLVFIIVLSFYSKLEHEYYVWSFSDTALGFLFGKIKTALVYSTFLSAPILIAMGIFFRSESGMLIIFQLLAYVYLLTFILAKYSSYPNEMNLPQGIIMGLCLLFPPLLMVVIPYFYVQSIHRLNEILA
ncbi:MAG: hypothetical protein ACERKD_19640 [Prolixibacteraceae bacterium]